MEHRTPSLIALVTLALGLLLAPFSSDAQQAGKVPRIGRLSAGFPPPAPNPALEAFQQGLRDLGYVEGQNLVVEYRYAEGRDDRLADLAAELVQLKVDVLVASGSPAVRAAQHATRTIPIVMIVATLDPVGLGFVASLAHPGGNITGFDYLPPELPGKRLELLKEMVPQSTRIAVLGNLANPSHEPMVHSLTVPSRTLGVQLHMLDVRRPEELDTAFTAMIREGADALLVLEDSQLLDSLRKRIAELAAKHRLPTMAGWKMYVEAGGLMSYGTSLLDMSRRAATYVDKILKGAKPADLPVEQSMHFELVINLKTAKALGLTIPPTLLFQANEVLQ